MSESKNNSDLENETELVAGDEQRLVAAVPNPPEADLDTSRSKRIEEKTYATSKISESCRYISFGTIAAFFTVVKGTDTFSKEIVSSFPLTLYLAGVFAVLTVIFDYAQYLAGSRAASNALEREDRAVYRKSWISWRARGWFFNAKQICTVIAASCFLWIILGSLPPIVLSDLS